MKSIKKQTSGSYLIGQYPVIVRPDVSGGYWVTCPILDGCYSQGETIEEALKNIKEAIELCLEDAPCASRQRQNAMANYSLHFVNV